MCWLLSSSVYAFVCFCVALVGALNDEGRVLLSFKRSLETQAGNDAIKWKWKWNSSHVNPCSWHGVSCSNEEKVVSITLSNYQLKGPLPASLAKLSSLQHVDLRNNKFSGSLPVDLFEARGLLSLVLSGNSFSGSVPSEIGNLEGLRTLDLSRNSFTDSIPSSIVRCKRLKTLVIYGNTFTGSLPDGFGSSLINLRNLDVSSNRLTGSIPGDIGDLTNLEGTLNLSHNFFDGPIPETMKRLSERLYIDLSYNNLSGKIPQDYTFVNLGPTAFMGNPFLCGIPIKTLCPAPSNQNLGPGTTVAGSKTDHRSLSTVIATVSCTVLGICLLGFLLSRWFKKTSRCKRIKDLRVCRLEDKSMISKVELFCFMKKGLDTLSEHMDEYSFVILDGKVEFDLDKLLKASAFLLGKSGFGIVYRVVVDEGLSVVVRRLGDDRWERYKEFQTEVEAIGKIRHRNIVGLRAYCWSVDEKLLIYDYIPNGDLATAIHGKPGHKPVKPLSWPVRLRIIKGIAKGLTFIHEFSPKRYVHGDLNPTNILLGEDMEPYISGFGLNRLLTNTSEEPTIHSERITTSYEFTAINSGVSSCCYQSPEVSKVTKPSQKWDVYSYGVILIEMVSGKWPIVQMGPLEIDLVQLIQGCLEERRPVCSVVDPILVHDMVDMGDEIGNVLKIGLACVCRSPDKRPSMRYVCDSLERLSS